MQVYVSWIKCHGKRTWILERQLTSRSMLANRKRQKTHIGGIRNWRRHSESNRRSLALFFLRVLQVVAVVVLACAWRAQSWHPRVEGGHRARGADSSLTGTARLHRSEPFPEPTRATSGFQGHYFFIAWSGVRRRYKIHDILWFTWQTFSRFFFYITYVDSKWTGCIMHCTSEIFWFKKPAIWICTWWWCAF